MKYVCYELDEDPEGSMSWYERVVSSIADKMAPLVNPDFYMKYDEVLYWWLELNEESRPMREIGFDQNGKAIVVGPLGKNKGIFTHGQPKVQGFYPVEMYQFVEQWESFEAVIGSESKT